MASQIDRVLMQLERRLAALEGRCANLPTSWPIPNLLASSPITWCKIASYDTDTDLYTVSIWDGSAWDANAPTGYTMQVPNHPTTGDETLMDTDDILPAVANGSTLPSDFDEDADYIALSTVPWAAWA